MTSFEETLMRNVTQRHILENPRPLVRSYEEFEKKWAGKNFRPTFLNVAKNRLTETQRIVINERYAMKMLYRDIADELCLSVARIREIELTAIDRLAEISVYKELLIGSEEYLRLIQEKQKEIENALHKDKGTTMLSDIGLDGRAFNLIAREVMCPKTELTASRVVEKIDDLTKIKGCGIFTALHIINRFRAAGLNTDKWEKSLSVYINTPYLKDKAEWYSRLDEKRRLHLIERKE